MKYIKYYTLALLIIGLLSSCTKDERMQYLDENAPAPSQVYDIHVESNPGGADITYKIPDDPNFSYLLAVYEIRPGVFREAKASVYTDTVSLVGFGDTEIHRAELFSVGRNEKRSDPVVIEVQPLTPPVQSVFQTIELVETFGGVQLSFVNESGANLAIELLMENEGEWSAVNTYYTGALEGRFSARGLPSDEKKFAVSIRDRWNNRSDSLFKVLTPLFEEFIPKNWAEVRLPTDSWQPANSAYSLTYLWNDKISGFGGSIFAGQNSHTLPNWFTIDLKQKVIISRVMMHHQESEHLYQGSAVKKFELYGSNAPASDGSWDSWDYLGTFDSFKPSGAIMGTNMPEDKQYGHVEGEEFPFDQVLTAYRYIRWKTLETYGSAGQVVIAEISLYGSIVD